VNTEKLTAEETENTEAKVSRQDYEVPNTNIYHKKRECPQNLKTLSGLLDLEVTT
jgi:hypothetical protein